MLHVLKIFIATLFLGLLLQAQTTRAVELTFLQSNPGERTLLKQFVIANWFEMDKVAKSQGLIEDYRVFDSGSDEGPWNVLVIVTYRNAKGYEGIAEAFEKIRKQHKVVPVDGKSLAQLGKIVNTKRLYE